LATDNRADLCSPCGRQQHDAAEQPDAAPAQAPVMPDEFWERPELRAAFGQQRFGAVLRAYRQALGGEVTQAQIAGWLKVSQTQVSRIERGKSAANDLPKLNRWAHQLQIPQRYRWFTWSDPTSDAYAEDTYPEQEAGSSLPATSPLAPSLEAGGTEDGTGVDRRDAIWVLTTGTVTAGLGLGAALVKDSPWQRLVDSLERKRPADPATVTLLEDRTADLFRAEETTPARELLLYARQHREDVRNLAVGTE